MLKIVHVLLAAGAVLSALSVPQAMAAPRANRFGRLFPELPAFASATPEVQAALLKIGEKGGILDAKDQLEAGPVALIVVDSLNRDNLNADLPNGPAGTTFMGQFMDHDMTFDTTSALGVSTRPERSPNARRPALDLDSVYGKGPIDTPQFYEPANRVKFKVESGGLFEDLPRSVGGAAIIADPRNDENLIIAGLHAAFLLFHNRAVDEVRAAGVSDPREVFAEARRLLTWHYQWIVLGYPHQQPLLGFLFSEEPMGGVTPGYVPQGQQKESWVAKHAVSFSSRVRAWR